MREQDRIIVWPVYFDVSRTRGDGRRVPKTKAVQSPKAQEVKESAEELGYNLELVPDVGYPKTPWLKTGMVLVRKKGSKNLMIARIAEQLIKIRSQTPTK